MREKTCDLIIKMSLYTSSYKTQIMNFRLQGKDNKFLWGMPGALVNKECISQLGKEGMKMSWYE